MKPITYLTAACLALSLVACSTPMNKQDSNPWLDLRAGSADYDISGKWTTAGSWGGDWGEANFIQDGARFYGQLGSYYVDGSMNGNYMYLALSSGSKVYYTAMLKREPDGGFAGKVARDCIIDGKNADNAGYQIMILSRPKPATTPVPKPGAGAPPRAM